METVATEPNQTERSGSRDANLLQVQACVISHRGCVRENNEDNFFFDGDLMPEDAVNEGTMIDMSTTGAFHLFAVCDGMGGLKGGERASAICVRNMGMLYTAMPAETVRKAVDIYAEDSCKKVYEDSLTIGEAGREGSTLALLYLTGRYACVSNVGDSRVYLLRGNRLFQLSTDQSPVYRSMMNGEITREQMRKHPRGNVISAFIGMPAERKPSPYVNHRVVELCMGDRFLVCSDGVSDLLSHEEIRGRLTQEGAPKPTASVLVERALEMGGKDNTTCIVIDVRGAGLPAVTEASLTGLPSK